MQLNASHLLPLAMLCAPVYAQTCLSGPDALEDNDDCNTAVAIPGNAAVGLNVEDVDHDFYTLTINPSDIVSIDVDHIAADGDIDVYLWDPSASCDTRIVGEGAAGNPLDYAFTGLDLENVSYINTSGVTINAIIEVRLWSGDTSGNTCNDYDISISVSQSSCGSQTPDALEDGDDCTTTVAAPIGFTSGLNVSDADPDFYTIAVPAGQIVTVGCYHSYMAGDIDTYLWDPSVSCDSNVVGEGGAGNPLALGYTSSDDEIISWANQTGATANIIFEARIWSNSPLPCNDSYDLEVTFMPDPCSTLPDDNFEDNDTCTTAAAVTAGSYTGLFVNAGDPDFYSITIPANNILTVDVFDTLNGDVDLTLYDSGCGVLNNYFGDGFSYANTTGAPETVTFECFFNTFSADTCTTYDMDVTVAVDPCSVLMADAYEPNDDCAGAAPITDGSYTGLNCAASNSDFFSFVIPNGSTFDAYCAHSASDADIDVYLWDPSMSCDTNVVGEGGGGGPLVYGFTGSDDETVTWTNTTGADINAVFEVRVWSGSLGQCADYSLDVTGTIPSGPGNIGTTFCPGNPNSTGAVGVTTAFGLVSAAANDVTLNADNLPVSQFGIFVTSMTAVTAVPVFDGLLCLGGQIGRYTQPSMIWQVNAMGHAELTIDLTMTPQGIGTIPVMPGDTWYYQAWHRDTNMGSSTSNFTTGVAVTYN